MALEFTPLTDEESKKLTLPIIGTATCPTCGETGVYVTNIGGFKLGKPEDHQLHPHIARGKRTRCKSGDKYLADL